MFEIVRDTKGSASHHMDIGRALGMEGNQRPRLRFYEWEGLAITAGIFSDPESLLDVQTCHRYGVEIAKRPTGGGVLFHGADLAFTIFIPGSALIGSVEKWCQRMNQRILLALASMLPAEDGSECVRSKERCRFCMSQITDFDLVWNGKKIGGCAQRKTRTGLLHQVSLFMAFPDWERISPCVRNIEDVKNMQRASVPLNSIVQFPVARGMLQESIINTFVDWEVE